MRGSLLEYRISACPLRSEQRWSGPEFRPCHKWALVTFLAIMEVGVSVGLERCFSLLLFGAMFLFPGILSYESHLTNLSSNP